MNLNPATVLDPCSIFSIGSSQNGEFICFSRSSGWQVELPPLSEFERMRTKFAEMSKTLEPVMAKA